MEKIFDTRRMLNASMNASAEIDATDAKSMISAVKRVRDGFFRVEGFGEDE